MMYRDFLKNKIAIVGGFALCIASNVFAETINFDQEKLGDKPQGWSAGVTGKGQSKWNVESDTTVPSMPNALKQSGRGDYLWCVKKDVSLKNGYVEVKFKPISGHEDQAGGIIWRWQNGNQYYVARANALENNVRIYNVYHGTRQAFMGADVKVTPNEWHTLRVKFVDDQFTVMFDGKVVIEATDDLIEKSGAVGVWTKADSIIMFDDFSYGENANKP